MVKQVALAEHEDMDRWQKLPVWAQQELERWRVDEAHQRGRAEESIQQTDDLIAAFGPLLDFLDELPEMPKLTALVEALDAPFKAIMATRETEKTGRAELSHEHSTGDVKRDDVKGDR